MRPFRSGGRRALRDELQATWNVYDAVRPIRREDFEAAAPPQSSAAEPVPSPGGAAEGAQAHGGATSDAVRLVLADGSTRTVRLDDAATTTAFTEATDAELAALFGVTEMDIREARKGARADAAGASK